MDLPADWRVRRPALDDVDEILAVVRASDEVALGYPDFSADDVREALTGPNSDPSRDSWLAIDADGAIVGWAYLENPTGAAREFVEVYHQPGRGGPAQRPLLDLALARVSERAAELGHPRMVVRAGAIPTEAGWVAALRDAGFEFVKRYARMRRPLAGVSPVPPAPPDGVTIRLVRPDDEADMRDFHRILDTAFRDTPDYDPQSYELWRERLTALPGIPGTSGSWPRWPGDRPASSSPPTSRWSTTRAG